jgi:hypothetical protein
MYAQAEVDRDQSVRAVAHLEADELIKRERRTIRLRGAAGARGEGLGVDGITSG